MLGDTLERVGRRTSGSRIGRWTLVREVGRSRSAEVYEARADDGTRGALKLHRQGALEGLHALRELARLRRVVHPNIAEVLDAGELDEEELRQHADMGALYLVTRFVDGPSLQAELTQSGTLPPPRAAEIALGLARGLSALHEVGLIHRDIKPSNVLLPHGLPASAAVLIDFGLAGKLEIETNTTRVGEWFGTPGYMAPEQAVGGRQDVRADLWGLGVLLHHMLHGRLPFDRTTVVDTLLAIVHEPLVLPPTEPGLAAILERALAKEPEARFSSSQEFARALEGWLSDSPGRSTVRPRAERASVTAATVPPPASAPRAPRPAPAAMDAERPAQAASPRRARNLSLVAGALAVVALALALALLTLRGPSPETAPPLPSTQPPAPPADLPEPPKPAVEAPPTGAMWLVPLSVALLVGGASAWALRRRRVQALRSTQGQLHDMRKQVDLRARVTESLALSIDALLAQSAGNPRLQLVTASLALEVEKLSTGGAPSLDNFVRLLDLLDQRAEKKSTLERYEKLITVSAAGVALIASIAGLRKELWPEAQPVLAIEGCLARVAAGMPLVLSPAWQGSASPDESRYVWLVDGERAAGELVLVWTAPHVAGEHEFVLVAGHGRATCRVQVVR